MPEGGRGADGEERAGAGLRILVADSLPRSAIDELEARGHECVVDPGLADSELADRIPGSTSWSSAAPRSRRASSPTPTGSPWSSAPARHQHHRTTAAAARGVLVANVPGRNSAAVAELTMGLLLAVDRRIPDNVVDLRAGRWNKKAYGKAAGLLGKTMGIVGLGSIGLAVAERAVSFGIKVQAVQKPREAYVETRIAELGITICSSLEELLTTSDIVSLHVPVLLGDQAPGRQDLPQPPAPRRDPAEHLAWRRRRRGGPAGGPRRRVGPRRPRRLRRRTRRRQGGVELRAGPAPRRRGDPPHRRVDRAGPALHRRGRGRDRRRLRRGRGPQLRQPRAQPARVGDADHPAPRPSRRARARPRPAERGQAERRAHGEPCVPRRRGGDGHHRRRGLPARGSCSPISARSPTCSVSPLRRSRGSAEQERDGSAPPLVRPLPARIVRQDVPPRTSPRCSTRCRPPSVLGPAPSADLRASSTPTPTRGEPRRSTSTGSAGATTSTSAS